MARLTDVKFQLSGTTYKLALDFDDAALVDDVVAFDVLAESDGGRAHGSKTNARVEIHPKARRILVFVNGVQLLDLDGFNTQPSQIEQLIDSIPAQYLTDPITGCMIKAGISAVVGQALVCFKSLESGAKWSKVVEFFRCMGTNFGAMSKVTMYRAFKCIWQTSTGA